MRAAICDDEEAFRLHTEELIQKWAAENHMTVDLCLFENGDALITQNSISRYDIIFLDIIMPLLNGIDTAAELRSSDKTVKIVFLTSSADFALASYAVKATDYCLKPVSYEKMKSILDDCLLSLQAEAQNLVVKTTDGYRKIYLREIEYIEAQNKKTYFYLLSGEIVEVLKPLYYFEEQLFDRTEFCKCHRSYLVYIPNIHYFNTSQIILRTGRNIPISRGFAKNFQNTYFSVMFGK